MLVRGYAKQLIMYVPLEYLTLGNRGLGTLQRVIMESVSNYVVNNASCPITVVKNPCHHHH
ncbi:hypothetical protein glysoja_029408 [Glycine soja]|uniref:UspA domain-containing protein n=1 Tax=Glycine soja TaxID=3848 RepID=A0A0B2PYW2_GLYSO|nr:hypothetical protein glysoja_029408 [Glycine soja]